MFNADLTNDQISMLCEIGEFDPEGDISEGKKRDLQALISGGYAEPTESQPGVHFRLTAKGSEFLSKRGVGLNES